MIDVGTASPMAQGQATIRTETPATSASSGAKDKPGHDCPGSDQNDGGNEPRGDLIDQCFHGKARALRVSYHLHDARQDGVATDPRRPDQECALAVHGCTGDDVSVSLGGRHRFAGQHAFVDQRTALHDDPVHGNPFAGAYADPVARLEAFDRAILVTGLRHDPGKSRLQPDQGLNCRSCLSLGSCFQQPAEEDQHDDHSRRLEIDGPCVDREKGGQERCHGREPECRRSPQRDKRVHVGAASQQGRDAAFEEPAARSCQGGSNEQELQDPARLKTDCLRDEMMHGGINMATHLDQEDRQDQRCGNQRVAGEQGGFFLPVLFGEIPGVDFQFVARTLCGLLDALRGHVADRGKRCACIRQIDARFLDARNRDERGLQPRLAGCAVESRDPESLR